MEEVIKKYLAEHTLEEVNDDWKMVQTIELSTNLKKWMKFLQDAENLHDEFASYIYSTMLRPFTRLAQNSDDPYSKRNFEEIKKEILEDIKYNLKHSRKEEKKFFEELNSKLKDYYLA